MFYTALDPTTGSYYARRVVTDNATSQVLLELDSRSQPGGGGPGVIENAPLKLRSSDDGSRVWWASDVPVDGGGSLEVVVSRTPFFSLVSGPDPADGSSAIHVRFESLAPNLGDVLRARSGQPMLLASFATLSDVPQGYLVYDPTTQSQKEVAFSGIVGAEGNLTALTSTATITRPNRPQVQVVTVQG